MLIKSALMHIKIVSKPHNYLSEWFVLRHIKSDVSETLVPHQKFLTVFFFFIKFHWSAKISAQTLAGFKQTVILIIPLNSTSILENQSEFYT